MPVYAAHIGRCKIYKSRSAFLGGGCRSLHRQAQLTGATQFTFEAYIFLKGGWVGNAMAGGWGVFCDLLSTPKKGCKITGRKGKRKKVKIYFFSEKLSLMV